MVFSILLNAYLVRNFSIIINHKPVDLEDITIHQNFLSLIQLSDTSTKDLDPKDLLIIYNHIVFYLQYVAIPKMLKLMSQTFTRNNFFYVRNVMDVFLKITNTPNRVQATTGLKRPSRTHDTEFSDLGTISKLIYVHPNNFCRLFLNDKTGLVKNIPSIVPLNDFQNECMGIYLYWTKDMKTTWVFPTSTGGGWKNSSSDEIKFILAKTGLTRMLFPTVHFMRNLFLNAIGVRYNYQQVAFESAGILLRHHINQIQNDYIKWTRAFHNKYWDDNLMVQTVKRSILLIDYELLLTEAFSYVTNIYRPIHPLDNKYISDNIIDVKKPVTETKIQSKHIKQTCQYDKIIGIDASPKCIALSILDVKENSIQTVVWCNRIVNIHNAYVNRMPKTTSEKYEVICQYLTDLAKDKKYCCGIEGPLEPNKRVDSKQTKFVRDMIEFLSNNTGFEISKYSPKQIHRKWLEFAEKDPWGSVMLAEIKKTRELKTAKLKNFLSYNIFSYKNEYQMTLPHIIIPIIPHSTPAQRVTWRIRIKNIVDTHPISDIVDSVAVVLFMYLLDINRTKYRKHMKCARIV